ncbi:angiopoietin-related protein 7 [Cherax quadricarinatus]
MLCTGVMKAVWPCVLAVGLVTWIACGSDALPEIPQSQDGSSEDDSVSEADSAEDSMEVHELQNGKREERNILGMQHSNEAQIALQQRQKAQLEGKLRQLEFKKSNMASRVRRARATVGLGTGTAAVLQPVFQIPSSARPVDCADLLVMGATRSGVYDIYPFTCRCSNKVQVWCDMETDGGGWTVFLSRQTQIPREDFNRSWTEYKHGFGNRDGEYWLGTENLYTMTTSRNYNLRLDLILPSGIPQYTEWQDFKVGPEESRYRLSWSTFTSLDFSLTSNCLSYANGRSFSTYDQDEDSYSDNCALIQGGGWWYYNCLQFNPTNSGSRMGSEAGLNITCFNHDFISLSKLQLKIRPTVCSENIKSIYLNHYQRWKCGDLSMAPAIPQLQLVTATAPTPFPHLVTTAPPPQLALTAAPVPSPQLALTAAPAFPPQLAPTAEPALPPQLTPTAAPAFPPQLAPTAAPAPSFQLGTTAAPVPPPQLGTTAAPVPPPQVGTTAAPVPPPQVGTTAAPVPPLQLGVTAAPVYA